MAFDLSIVETDELVLRAKVVLGELDERLRRLGPLMKEVGHLRAEVGLVFKELERRGVDPGEIKPF